MELGASGGPVHRQQPPFGVYVLTVRYCGNPGTVPTPHQDAILGLAEVRDAHGEPDPDRRQRHGESQGGDIGQHAMAEVVGRIVTAPFVAGEVVGGRRAGRRRFIAAARRMGRRPRPEFDHDVRVVAGYRPLGLHCCRYAEVVILSSTLAGASDMKCWRAMQQQAGILSPAPP